MKKSKKGTKKEDKAKFVDKSKKRQSHKKSRHFDKKTVKDMMDYCKPEEYNEYSEYYWDEN